MSQYLFHKHDDESGYTVQVVQHPPAFDPDCSVVIEAENWRFKPRAWAQMLRALADHVEASEEPTAAGDVVALWKAPQEAAPQTVEPLALEKKQEPKPTPTKGLTAKQQAVLDAIRTRLDTNQPINQAVLAIDTQSALMTVSTAIKKLAAKGLLHIQGQGRGRQYSLEPFEGDAPRPAAKTVNRRFTEAPKPNPDGCIPLRKDHPALIEGRTLFPSTVVDPSDSPRLLVSGQNSRKLGDRIVKGPWSGFPIYQLTLEERATCPRSCFHWATCYGSGMQMARRHRNTPDLTTHLHRELKDLQDAHPQGFAVRLHVLGDFYSTEYVAAWAGFLMEFPALHVWGYTMRAPDSPIGAEIKKLTDVRWSRFAVRFSSEEPGPQTATTIWRLPEADVVPEGIVCPAETGKTDCCGTCGLCWSDSARDKPIAFIAHGRSQKAKQEQPRAVRPTPTRQQPPVKNVSDTAAAIAAFMKTRGVRKIERGATGDMSSVMSWLQERGLNVRWHKNKIYEGTRLISRDRFWEIANAERRKQGLEPFSVGEFA